MTAAFWGRFGLIWSGGFVVLSSWWAIAAANPTETVIHGVCGMSQAMLFFLTLRALRRDRRHRELLALRRRLALRGSAHARVWEDRMTPGSPRSHLAGVAMVGAYRAIDELNAVRVAMGEVVLEVAK